MNTLNQIRRRLVSYAVMLTFLAAMSMVVGFSSSYVMSGAEKLNADRQQTETIAE